MVFLKKKRGKKKNFKEAEKSAQHDPEQAEGTFHPNRFILM